MGFGVSGELTRNICYVYNRYMKTILNVKTDVDVKLGAQKVAHALGLPLSTVVNAYLKEFIRNRGIAIALAPKMSKSLERLVARVERDIKADRNMSPIFNTTEGAIGYLDSLSR